jgi:hypothetical protein
MAGSREMEGGVEENRVSGGNYFVLCLGKIVV